MRLESIAREAAAERVDIEARLSEELKAKKKVRGFSTLESFCFLRVPS